MAEDPTERPEQTRNEGERVPIEAVNEGVEPVSVALKITPKEARVEALTKGVEPGEGGDTSWVFDDKSPPPPWEFKVSGSGRKTAYLRIEPEARLGDRLRIVFGREGAGQGIAWMNTHRQITLQGGRYEIVVKLDPARPPRNNLKNAVPR